MFIGLAVVILSLSSAFAEDYTWPHPPLSIPDAYRDEYEPGQWEINYGLVSPAIYLIGETRIVEDVNVTINVTHPRPSDLRIVLLGPDLPTGVVSQIMLADGLTGTGGSYTFDDEQLAGALPPAEALSLFDGMTGSAIWTLAVYDKAVDEVGTLNSWTLSITYAGGGPAPTVALDPPSPDTLWPPNGKAKSVTISGSVEDAGGGIGAVWLSVDDEYDLADVASIEVDPDADGEFSVSINLAAARNEDDMDGRCYTIYLHAGNEGGSDEASDSVEVVVPRSRR
jgi:subtilisin-like proprotein convertase family protein